MAQLEDYKVLMDDEDLERFVQRALLPFPADGEMKQLSNSLDRQDEWVQNQLSSEYNTLPLPETIEMVELAREKVFEENETEIFNHNGTEYLVLNEYMQERISLLPGDEISKKTGKEVTTLQNYRQGRTKGVPREFWIKFIEELERRQNILDQNPVRAEIIDSERFTGGGDLEASTLARNLSLDQIQHFASFARLDFDTESIYTDAINSMLYNVLPKDPSMEQEVKATYFMETAVNPGMKPAFSVAEGHFAELVDGLIKSLEKGNTYIGPNAYTADIGKNRAGRGLAILEEEYDLLEPFNSGKYSIVEDIENLWPMRGIARYIDQFGAPEEKRI